MSISVDDATLKNFANIAERSVCPIVVEWKKQAAIQGTGTLVRQANRCYVVTARHVLEERPRDSFLAIPEGPEGKTLVRLSGFESVDLDPYDVAVVRLPESDWTRKIESSWNVLAMDGIDRLVWRTDGPYFLFGYPTKLSVFDGKSIRSKTFAFRLENTHAPRNLPGVDPNVDFFVKHPETARLTSSNKQVPMPDIHGISGCAVWKINETKMYLPAEARLTLAGFETGLQDAPSPQWIRCRRWVVVLALLDGFDRKIEEARRRPS